MEAEHRTARKWPWGTIFGLAAVGLYISFTSIAIVLFPTTVSPLTTYLSMLGNADISPEGAIFYNLAVILGGLAEIPFFGAIFVYHLRYGRKWLLRIGLLAGIINGVSVFMSGVYAEHINMHAHVTWSYIIFFSLIPVLLAYGLAFWTVPGASRRVSLYGFLVCAIDVFFLSAILSRGLDPGLGSIMEWVSVFAFLGWVALVSLDMLKRSPAEGRG